MIFGLGRYREDGACLDCFYAANSIWLYSKATKYSAFERLKPNHPHHIKENISRLDRLLLSTLDWTVFGENVDSR